MPTNSAPKALSAPILWRSTGAAPEELEDLDEEPELEEAEEVEEVVDDTTASAIVFV